MDRDHAALGEKRCALARFDASEPVAQSNEVRLHSGCVDGAKVLQSEPDRRLQLFKIGAMCGPRAAPKRFRFR